MGTLKLYRLVSSNPNIGHISSKLGASVYFKTSCKKLIYCWNIKKSHRGGVTFYT